MIIDVKIKNGECYVATPRRETSEGDVLWHDGRRRKIRRKINSDTFVLGTTEHGGNAGVHRLATNKELRYLALQAELLLAVTGEGAV